MFVRVRQSDLNVVHFQEWLTTFEQNSFLRGVDVDEVPFFDGCADLAAAVKPSAVETAKLPLYSAQQPDFLPTPQRPEGPCVKASTPSAADVLLPSRDDAARVNCRDAVCAVPDNRLSTLDLDVGWDDAFDDLSSTAFPCYVVDVNGASDVHGNAASNTPADRFVNTDGALVGDVGSDGGRVPHCASSPRLDLLDFGTVLGRSDGPCEDQRPATATPRTMCDFLQSVPAAAGSHAVDRSVGEGSTVTGTTNWFATEDVYRDMMTQRVAAAVPAPAVAPSSAPCTRPRKPTTKHWLSQALCDDDAAAARPPSRRRTLSPVSSHPARGSVAPTGNQRRNPPTAHAGPSVGTAKQQRPVARFPSSCAGLSSDAPASGGPSAANARPPLVDTAVGGGNSGNEAGGVGGVATGGGAGVVRALPEAAVALLKAWMLSPEHVDHPYPTDYEKAELAVQAGITVKQLSIWFTNARKRLWVPLRRKQGKDVPSYVDSCLQRKLGALMNEALTTVGAVIPSGTPAASPPVAVSSMEKAAARSLGGGAAPCGTVVKPEPAVTSSADDGSLHASAAPHGVDGAGTFSLKGAAFVICAAL